MADSPAGPAAYLEEAVRMALENVRQGRGGPFGALVVREGNIVGRGVNMVTSLRDPTAHAEVVAIREACHHLENFRLAGCVLYATGEPCPMCWGAIFWARLERVYYAAGLADAAAAGFDDRLFFRELGKPPDQRIVPGARVPLASVERLFEEWRRKEDRVDY
jgi:tRNA(Arg) A34 adenosine deaminase TadA